MTAANDDAMDDPIPVTVLSGSLGAGKTTLVNHLLANPGERTVAVIVNDMGEVNIDAELLANEPDESGDEREGIVDLTNGCICCRLQDDLLAEAKRLVDSREFDYLVVEASGISEPIPIARAFTLGTEESDIDPGEYFDLDTMVTVLDSYGFWKEFDAGASIPDPEDAARPLADVLIEGVEFCDVLLLNKCDMVPDEVIAEIERVAARLGPRATVVRTTYSEIDADEILDTGAFDFEEATRAPGWKHELAGGDGHSDGDKHSEGDGPVHDHTHDGRASAAETHGVSSFVYRESRPFHPGRFDAWLDGWPDGVIRAKGFFSLAGRDDVVMGLSQAGPSVQAGPIGEWRGDDPETKLVFIGTEMDEHAMRAALDGCLATDAELSGDKDLADPFPTT